MLQKSFPFHLVNTKNKMSFERYMIGPTDDLIASMSEKYDLNSWFVNVSLKFLQ